jgi:hypothetical protein
VRPLFTAIASCLHRERDVQDAQLQGQLSRGNLVET